LACMAQFYDFQRLYGDADPLHQRAVAIAQKSLGPQHPDTILYTKNLIACYRAQNKNKEANELERQLENVK